MIISTQTPATATAMLYTALADMWPHVVFTVTANDAALTISWSDGPSKDSVCSLLHRFLPDGGHLWDQAVLLSSPEGHLGISHMDIADIALHRTIVTGEEDTVATPSEHEYGLSPDTDYGQVVDLVRAVDCWLLHRPSFTDWSLLLEALHQPWLTCVFASCVDEVGPEGLGLLRACASKAEVLGDRLAMNTAHRMVNLYRDATASGQASWSMMSELSCWTFQDWADSGAQIRLFAGVSGLD